MLNKTLRIYKPHLPKVAFACLAASTFQASAALDASAALKFDLGNAVPGGGICTSGSCFGMEVSTGLVLWTNIEAKSGIIIGTSQPATGSHSGVIDGSESPNVDNPWQFFGNTGLHQTTSVVTIISDDTSGNVVLDLSSWDVTWNGIASIPMSSNAHSGGTDGEAVMTCAADCSIGDTYELDYFATVPEGDPSGFGGVKYSLKLRGSIDVGFYGNGNTGAAYDVTDPTSGNATFGDGTVVPGTLANSLGNATGSGLTTSDVGVDPLINPEDGQQCVGGCFDFEVTGIAGSNVMIAFPINGTIPAGAVYRKLINGEWVDFDTSTGDQVGSQAATGGACQSPDGFYDIGLIEGHDCIFLRIEDGGPNDADGKADGNVADPGGLAIKGSPIPVIPTPGNDGCSMSGNTTNLMHRADWLLIAGFMLWVGMVVRKKQA